MKITKSDLQSLMISLLSEGKSEDLVARHPELQAAYDRGVKKESYLQWLLKMKEMEPIADIISLVIEFDKQKNRLTNKDLNSYARPSILRQALEDLGQSKTSVSKSLKADETTVVYEDEEFKVVMPHTVESSTQWGKGTTWCTAATQSANLFYSYVAKKSEDIILYYILRKGGDPRKDPLSKMSIGFRDGEIDFEETMGGITVDAHNNGLTLNVVKETLGEKFEKIFRAIENNSEKIGNKHPAKAHLQKIANSDDIAFLAEYTGKMSEEQKHEFFENLIEYDLGDNIKNFIANDEDERVRLSFCMQEEKMTPALLAKFAHDSSKDIRRVVALHKKTPRNSLFLLARDEDIIVRNYLTNRMCDYPELIHQLSIDSSPIVRSTVARSDCIPRSILVKLLHDTDENVRANASYNVHLTHDELLELAKDESNIVRHNLAFNKSLSKEIIMAVIENSKKGMSPELRESLAENPHTPDEYLEKFSTDSERMVRIKVASNTSTPQHVLDNLSRDSDLSVKLFVAGNTSTSVKTLLFLESLGNSHILSCIAKNKKAPPEILARLANHENSAIVNHVAQNPRTTADILNRLAESPDADTRYWALGNKNVDVNTLIAHSDDSSSNARLSVSRHEKTPIEILEKLANDKNKNVRMSALKSIASRSKNQLMEKWNRIITV